MKNKVKTLTRAEAVKLVKRLSEISGKDFYCLECDIAFDCCENRICKHSCGDYPIISNSDYEASDSYGAVCVLKYLFNLTEEDLK